MTEDIVQKTRDVSFVSFFILNVVFFSLWQLKKSRLVQPGNTSFPERQCPDFRWKWDHKSTGKRGSRRLRIDGLHAKHISRETASIAVRCMIPVKGGQL